MALRAIKLMHSTPRLLSLVSRSAHSDHQLVLKEGEIAGVTPLIGARKIVGYGRSGQLIYHEDIQFPYPALTFKEITPAVNALLDKQKGDWKNLTNEEIKTIYRTNFCQTFAEMTAPTNHVKSSMAYVFGGISLALIIWYINKTLVYTQLTLPESFSEENKYHRMWREIDSMKNPVFGVASKWDYENKRWKD